MRQLVCIGLVALFVFGCSHYGNEKITDSSCTDQIVIGKSTKEDVKKVVGEPLSVTFNENGTETWMYVYNRTKTRASTFIPVVGALVGGADVEMYSLNILIDENGIVKKIGKGKSTGGAGGVND